ncbi:hypothetical protein ACVKS2_004901, partial [Pseudomonas sp. PvP125]
KNRKGLISDQPAFFESLPTRASKIADYFRPSLRARSKGKIIVIWASGNERKTDISPQ